MKTTILTILTALVILALIGCDQNSDIVYVYEEDYPPPVPQGVSSTTGDEEVLITWLPIDDVNGDFATYVVYRSDHHPDTGYWEIGQTTHEYFVDDYNITNGHTYYYAVSSMDVDGNLSALSFETVQDTPRPQGSGEVMFDFDYLPNFAGWDFSEAGNINYLNSACDLYLEYHPGDGVYYLNVANIYTDIQDMGYTGDFDEIGYAPAEGWSQNGWYEVILFHTYVIWTDDYHFAKIRVTEIGEDYIEFEWAYQVAVDNQELKPKVEHDSNYLRHPQDGE